MRITIALLIAALAILTAGTAFAQTCDFSGAPTEDSEARMKVRVRGDDGVLRTHYFGGPAHSFYHIHDVYGEDPEIHSSFVVDYAAAQDGDSTMLNADSAWFLVDTDIAASGTAADPSVVAFATQAEAQQWQGRLGGELVQGYDAVWSWLDEMYHNTGGNMGDRHDHYGRN